MKITNALFKGGRRFRTDTEDFRNFVVVQEKEIAAILDDGTLVRFLIPVGAESDLASTPPILWGPPENLPPFGDYAAAAFAHDAAYRDTLLKWDGSWVKASLTKDESDDLLNALMFSCGVTERDKFKIYEGVHLLGWSEFRKDREDEQVSTNPTAPAN